MTWDWAYAWHILPDLFAGVVVTVLVTAGCAVIALIGGLLLAVFESTAGAAGRIPVRALLGLFRGVPILVFLYFGFYALPEIGVVLPAYVVGVSVLGVVYAAYCSEVYRGALITIPTGLRDACTALGLSPTVMWWKILIPIAIRKSAPALVNYILVLYKQTSLLFAIGVPVLFARAQILGSESFRYLEPYTLTGIIYLAINLPVVAVLHGYEKRRGEARA
jgi:polar amino acid transport system permease protein